MKRQNIIFNWKLLRNLVGIVIPVGSELALLHFEVCDKKLLSSGMKKQKGVVPGRGHPNNFVRDMRISRVLVPQGISPTGLGWQPPPWVCRRLGSVVSWDHHRLRGYFQVCGFIIREVHLGIAQKLSWSGREGNKMRPSLLFALALVLSVSVLTGVADHEYIYRGAVGVCVGGDYMLSLVTGWTWGMELWQPCFYWTAGCSKPQKGKSQANAEGYSTRVLSVIWTNLQIIFCQADSEPYSFECG